jgi:hypothetical protein
MPDILTTEPNISLRVHPESTSIVEAFFDVSADRIQEARAKLAEVKERRGTNLIISDLMKEGALNALLRIPNFSLPAPLELTFYGIKDSAFSAQQAREKIILSRLTRDLPPSPPEPSS